MAKMDLKLAYNKVDNLCCLNHNTFSIINDQFERLFEEGKISEPIKVDFFEGYKYSQDEDFCKDVNEMVDALETIKEVVDLQDKLGCPLNVFFKAFDGIYIMDDWHQLYFAKPVFIGGNFEIKQHYGVYDVATYVLYLKDYKKTWWLKEDRSE